MKVMVLGKATERSEAVELGSPEEFVAMNRFTEELVEAGVVLAGDGAVEWVKRSPLRDTEVELRKVLDAEDFDESFGAEIAAAEQQLRTDPAANQ